MKCKKCYSELISPKGIELKECPFCSTNAGGEEQISLDNCQRLSDMIQQCGKDIYQNKRILSNLVSDIFYNNALLQKIIKLAIDNDVANKLLSLCTLNEQKQKIKIVNIIRIFAQKNGLEPVRAIDAVKTLAIGLGISNIILENITTDQITPVNLLPAPTINYFKSNKTKIEIGGNIILEWQVNHASRIILTDGIHNINISKRKKYAVRPTQIGSTTYKLVAIAKDSKINITETINIEILPALQIQFFMAQPGVITDIFPTELSWLVTGARKIKIDQGIGEVTEQGKIEVRPSSHTSYRLTAIGELREIIQEVSVQVLPTPILEKLFVSTPDFESWINLDKSKLSIPKIDMSINLPEIKMLDFNFDLPMAAEPLINIQTICTNKKSKKSIFNFSDIYEYVRKKVKFF